MANECENKRSECVAKEVVEQVVRRQCLLCFVLRTRKKPVTLSHRFACFGLLKRNGKVYTQNKCNAFCVAKMFL